MANNATSHAEIRDRLREQLLALAASAENAGAAAALSEPRRWTQLELGDWDGDLTNISEIPQAFDREEIAQDYKDAIKDSTSPGTVGDLMISQLQGDYLAIQQRAFLARHAGHVRNLMHAAGRRRGHGHAAGVIRKGLLGYLEELLKKAKDA